MFSMRTKEIPGDESRFSSRHSEERQKKAPKKRLSEKNNHHKCAPVLVHMVFQEEGKEIYTGSRVRLLND